MNIKSSVYFLSRFIRSCFILLPLLKIRIINVPIIMAENQPIMDPSEQITVSDMPEIIIKLKNDAVEYMEKISNKINQLKVQRARWALSPGSSHRAF